VCWATSDFRYVLSALKALGRELRRRRVLRTGALYVVGAWLILQVADVSFPGFGIPDAAIGALIWALVIGFPIALVFGWFFDIGPTGIRRTAPLDGEGNERAPGLTRTDYLILGAFVAVAGGLLYKAAIDVLQAPAEPGRLVAEESEVARLPKLENSLAVLAFANLSSDPENEYFCDGVSEEILNQLALVQSINVIGRTSSFAFKGSEFGIARISQLLGVRYVLQGSVRKSGDQLRIAAQLLDERGLQIWAHTFDQKLRDVFEIQSEIASAVTRAVASELGSRPVATHVPDIEAYEHFLAGRELLHRRDSRAAGIELRRAIAIDPEYAEAHAELAISLSVGLYTDYSLAREHIDRALELQPELLRARAALGLWLQATNPPDYTEAERILRQVRAQEPNSSDALLWLSGVLADQGRDDEADEILAHARRIDPFHPSITVGVAQSLLEQGRTEQATVILQHALEQPRPPYWIYTALRDVFRATGRLVELNEVSKRQVLELQGPHYFSIALSYGLVEDWDRANYWFERSRRDHPEALPSHFAPVSLPTWKGQFDLAIARFEEALQSRPGGLSELNPSFAAWLGALHAKAGDYAAAIDLLAPLVSPATAASQADVTSLDPVRALAWSYLHTGRDADAVPLLESWRKVCREWQSEDALNLSTRFYACAETAVLGGESDQALSWLEQAVDAGWRELHILETDPYWTTLHENPRFRRLRTLVRADVERQRAEIERLDARDDFVAKLDEAIASQGSTAE